jgi:enamine deaminase RidA (YjgF/YER057c/UK114 family)
LYRVRTASFYVFLEVLSFLITSFSYDYTTHTISASPVEQAEQCMQNITSALASAGASIADVVRVRYIFPDRKDFEPCWPVFRKWFGEVKPAATMIVAGLAEEEMRVEIEVTVKMTRSEGSVGAPPA